MEYTIIARADGFIVDDWRLGYTLDSRHEADDMVRKVQRWNPWHELTLGRTYPDFEAASGSPISIRRVASYHAPPHTELKIYWRKPNAPIVWDKKPHVYERYGNL